MTIALSSAPGSLSYNITGSSSSSSSSQSNSTAGDDDILAPATVASSTVAPKRASSNSDDTCAWYSGARCYMPRDCYDCINTAIKHDTVQRRPICQTY